ncbi:hypothetical protein [Plasmodium yoelii yoelii]|uniref:Uncharacterized protein n=1 Tax=Plasmodium yoelii yoelii TaxID=73239 RepID=Q7RDU9_PLAYO|nr:hypothetical protein [Plasmodium yoelii yoelii]
MSLLSKYNDGPTTFHIRFSIVPWILLCFRQKSSSKETFFFSHSSKNENSTLYSVSDDITIIVYTSSNTDDYNSVDKTEYVNPIVDSAHLVKPKIYSEKDIRDGELTKMFVNLSGYIIQKKKDCVDITYLDSIDINAPMFENILIRIVHSAHILNILNISTIISMK